MKIKTILAFLAISFTSLSALPSHTIDLNKTKQIMCLYGDDINADAYIKSKRITKTEHIENLLYNPKHKNKYFLKALVLDYYYKINGDIEKYYKRAFSTVKAKEKIGVGIYYANYLLRHDNPVEAIKILRQIEVLVRKKGDIREKIAQIYELSGLEINAKMKGYFSRHKISIEEVKEGMNECGY